MARFSIPTHEQARSVLGTLDMYQSSTSFRYSSGSAPPIAGTAPSRASGLGHSWWGCPSVRRHAPPGLWRRPSSSPPPRRRSPPRFAPPRPALSTVSSGRRWVDAMWPASLRCAVVGTYPSRPPIGGRYRPRPDCGGSPPPRPPTLRVQLAFGPKMKGWSRDQCRQLGLQVPFFSRLRRRSPPCGWVPRRGKRCGVATWEPPASDLGPAGSPCARASRFRSHPAEGASTRTSRTWWLRWRQPSPPPRPRRCIAASSPEPGARARAPAPTARRETATAPRPRPVAGGLRLALPARPLAARFVPDPLTRRGSHAPLCQSKKYATCQCPTFEWSPLGAQAQ